MKKYLKKTLILITLVSTQLNVNGAAVIGNLESAPGTYIVGGNNEFRINFSIDQPNLNIQLTRIQTEVGKQGSISEPLLLTAYASNGMVSQDSYVESNFNNGTLDVEELDLSTPLNLQSGTTYSLIFSAPTLSNGQWYKFADVGSLTFYDPQTKQTITDITYERGDQTLVVPEPHEYALFMGLMLVVVFTIRYWIRKNQQN